MSNYLELDTFVLYNEPELNGWDSGFKHQKHNVCVHAVSWWTIMWHNTSLYSCSALPFSWNTLHLFDRKVTVLRLNSIWPLCSGFQNICAASFSAPHTVFVQALFSLSGAICLFVVMHVSHWREKKRTSMYLFLCTTLVSPSSAAWGQEQKSLCIQRERERERPGRRVAKATGNSAGMVVKEEGVWTDRDNWKRQGTPLCIKILHTPFRGRKREVPSFFKPN